MTELRDVVTLLAVVGSGLMGGIFFTFSNFVMRALGQIPDDQGIAAMQRINVTVLNSWFFLAFFGTGVLCAMVAFFALSNAAGAVRVITLIGAVFYLLGSLLVTVIFSVPLNNRLASADPTGAEARDLWDVYLSRWTLWNHIRTVSCFVAAILIGISLVE